MRTIPESELIINSDGSIFHLHVKPEQLADRIVMVGDPARVTMVSSYFDTKECEISNREYHTVTGVYQGKRITVLSHGIGTGNIDIVLNELDALANIDFNTRTVKTKKRQLSLVRIGTSGGLQSYTPIGSYVAAVKSIGFDGVIYFYKDNEKVRDLDFEDHLFRQLEWKIENVYPYVVSADPTLLKQICCDDIISGVTIAANGFYGPQGRELRVLLEDTELNKKVGAFRWGGYRITNFEMESSSLSGLAALMGHRAVTVCCIIAGRVSEDVNTDYKSSMDGLIRKVLERI